MRYHIIATALIALTGSEAAAEMPIACPLDGLKLKAAAVSDDLIVDNPGLIGKTFTVTRVSDHFIKQSDKDYGRPGYVVVGEITVEVSSGSDRFTVTQLFNPHSNPWVMATSSPLRMTGSVRRDRKQEAAYFTDLTASFEIKDGPLINLRLDPVNCPAWTKRNKRNFPLSEG